MTHSISARRMGAAGLLICVFALGCGGPRVRLTPVEGVVKINNKPAANIGVQFMPDGLKGGAGPTSFGTTDVEGKFRLQTNDGQEGAVVGPHRVVLVDLEEERPPQGRPAKKGPRLSGEYSVATTGLPVEVKEGGGPVVLEAKGP